MMEADYTFVHIVEKKEKMFWWYEDVNTQESQEKPWNGDTNKRKA